MYIQFEIETIFELKAHNNIYVLSRLITKNINGQLTDNSKLGGVAIEKWFDIPRAHDKEGTPFCYRKNFLQSYRCFLSCKGGL